MNRKDSEFYKEKQLDADIKMRILLTFSEKTILLTFGCVLCILEWQESRQKYSPKLWLDCLDPTRIWLEPDFRLWRSTGHTISWWTQYNESKQPNNEREKEREKNVNSHRKREKKTKQTDAIEWMNTELAENK